MIKKIKLLFVKGSSILRQQKLRGEFVDGYFSVNPKIGFHSPFFPILWGPGIYNISIGLTKEDNLLI